MSDTRPQFTLEQDGMFARVNMGYTDDTLDAMARRAAERIEDELVQQILARMGYVKPVRCRDCRYYDEIIHACGHPCVTALRGDCPENWIFSCRDSGFCAWGERRAE